MSQQSLLAHVLEALDDVGVAYMVTGSMASSIQGEPRSSHDIDIVVQLGGRAVGALLARFPAPEFYVSDEAARSAIRDRSMFNVLALSSGDKVDFWLLTHDPFDRTRFDRRVDVELFGRKVSVSSPEDTILQKLLWSRHSGGNERQERDALAVYELQFTRLDQPYMDAWAERLDVADRLETVRSRAEPLD